MRALPSTVALLATALTFAIAAPAARAQTPTPLLSLADAQKMIAAARQKATDMNLRLTIAVVDARGDLIALERMPGANPATADTALGKAMLSAIFGAPSAAMVQLGGTPGIGPALNDSVGGRFRFLQGAVPIIRNNVIVGAIAGSGATAAQDEEVARVGLASGS